ncbi:MAG: hypothetical protein CO145_02430 [Candidatus Nealsonbacteria bacterium CG_4_9_14_3_um_filter_37_13]|uniref:Uncharacterized protein n=2 Tax=Candidatus Nealsoniibacteriota TaxID=1817911 RepID=A0A2H0TJ09_9BACT|nr:MAG: hypothetical protein COU43_02115 [Candidatus Nealsonbacteria bacterium CG10_big_fil_rev_8_21_14_0_10_37_25]PJA84087.1 MAG: hypothetical protein CO145_02430 [Candidatus Nealsonbacteria bacterium CG_4_9_14_3_um_filter_37_13]
MVNKILHQNIIKELDIDALPEKEQEEALLRVGKIIFQSVLIRVMEKLNSEEKDQFTKLLTEKPDDEKAILDFLKSKIPNFNEIVNEEVAGFKKESLDFMKRIKE